jgi:hypothetical protein
MIWLDLKKMERKLSSNDISDKESVRYYLGIFIISSIYGIIVTLINKRPIDSSGTSVALYYLLNLIIIVIGVITIYKLNSKIDNKDFFLRFFSLSFVIFIRLIVYTICIGVLFAIIISFFIKLQDINKNIMTYIGLLWKIIYYILIALAFRKIAAIKKRNTENEK